MYRYVIALRYLKSRRITYFSILGVAVGVAALIIVLAVMEGFQNDFKSRIRGILSDIVVRYRGELPYAEVEKRILSVEHVEAAAPRLKGMGLIIGGGGRGAVQIVGIDVEKEIRVSKLAEYVINSRLTALAKEADQEIEALQTGLYRQLLLMSQDGGLPKSVLEDFRRTSKDLKALRSSLGKETNPSRMLAMVEASREKLSGFLLGVSKRTDMPGELRASFQAGAEFVDGQLNKKKRTIEETRASCEESMSSYRETGEFDIPFEDPVAGDEIILGEVLLMSLKVLPGETVRIYSSGGRDLASMEDESDMAKCEFRVAGTFRSRMYRYDSQLVFVPLKTAQRFQSREGMISEIGVKVDEFRNAEAVKAGIRKLLPGADVKTWAEKRRTLLAAINLEKVFLTVVLFMIIVVAGFNMLATFLMMVTEKTRDLGILKALGGSTLGISSIFFLCGVMIAIVGSAIGAGFGLLFVKYINEIEGFVSRTTGITPFPRDVYYLDRIPTIVDGSDVFWILFPTVAISVLLGSVLPALKAARMDPQQALRYE
jgi:lipoprotein-releasing system permease protein